MLLTHDTSHVSHAHFSGSIISLCGRYIDWQVKSITSFQKKKKKKVKRITYLDTIIWFQIFYQIDKNNKQLWFQWIYMMETICEIYMYACIFFGSAIYVCII